MATTQLRRILVTGATGKQGGALINSLLASQPSSPFHLIALTRDANTARAKSLAARTNVSIIEGDLDNVNAVFQKLKQPVYGVFSVQTVQKNDLEEGQGKALIDAAVKNGVQHFVYSSVDRGGFERSNVDPTPIPHFKSKHNIELHLQEVASKSASGMKWTIIRPVAFMDNFTDNFVGKAFGSMLDLNGRDTKLQLVAAQDIGICAAEAFKAPEQYKSQAISLATDSVSPQEADEIFRRVTGSPQPKTFLFVARLLKWFAQAEFGVMLDWFKEKGFGADPEAVRRQYPQMQTFETWLASSSAFRRKQK